MLSLRGSPAFDFDELQLDWGDVVLAAIGWGEWQSLERSLASALVAAAASEERSQEIDPRALRSAVVSWRRARGLLAGEDFLRWLSDRSLSTADLQAHLIRALATPADVNPALEIDAVSVADEIDAEAILSGRLQSWADRLVRCAASARGIAAAGRQPPEPSDAELEALVDAAAECQASGLERGWLRERARRIAALQIAERAFATELVTRERLERLIAEHQLDWQRFAWEELTFATEGAAREAALLVRADGLGLTEVAGIAHAAIGTREAYSHEVPELAPVLAAAAPGELLGPFTGSGTGAERWRLVLMHKRTSPAIDDAVINERARRELVQDGLERFLAGRVVWHGKY
jgi:hypothetical protein